MTTPFDYSQAFSRNIGWVTDAEQLILKGKRVAIAGMGGVGGFHLLTLARLGIGHYHISDFDRFELVNFNRQVGAYVSTLGLSKADTLKRMAQDINPEATVRVFDRLSPDNIDAFLDGVDLYIDGLDFFVLDARELVFQRCASLGIPVITAAPIGMGTSYLIFTKDSMSFEDYFRFDNKSRRDKLINFIIGLTPKPMHLSYLVERKNVSFKREKGPSTVMSCEICAGVTGVEALKLLLNRGKVYAAPYCNQFDVFRGKFKQTYTHFGNNNPIQRLKHYVVDRVLQRAEREQELRPVSAPVDDTVMTRVLELARWAPSGDNLQPWRFKLNGDNACTIVVHDEGGEDFYDFAGKPSALSNGCLLESIRLAAAQSGWSVQWKTGHYHDGKPSIDVTLEPCDVEPDADRLASYIMARSVSRKKFSRSMPPETILNKAASLPDPGFSLRFLTEKDEKKQMIAMNMLATQVRLSLKKCHDVHVKVLRWNNENTPSGMPYTAAGLNRFSAEFFRKFHKNWGLLSGINRYLGGAWLSSLELDYVPGKHCAGFFSITAEKPIESMTLDDLLRAGMQIQRIWLYFASRNMVIQPCYMPIILSWYLRESITITEDPSLLNKLQAMHDHFSRLGFDGKTIFMARFGYPLDSKTTPRSVRLDLSELLLP